MTHRERRYTTQTPELNLDLASNNLNNPHVGDGLSVSYSTNGPNGLFTTYNNWPPATMFGRTAYSLTLPANTNPSQVVVLISVVASSTNMSGTTTAGIYDARIVATQ